MKNTLDEIILKYFIICYLLKYKSNITEDCGHIKCTYCPEYNKPN